MIYGSHCHDFSGAQRGVRENNGYISIKKTLLWSVDIVTLAVNRNFHPLKISKSYGHPLKGSRFLLPLDEHVFFNLSSMDGPRS